MALTETGEKGDGRGLLVMEVGEGLGAGDTTETVVCDVTLGCGLPLTPVTFSQTGSVWLGDGDDGETTVVPGPGEIVPPNTELGPDGEGEATTGLLIAPEPTTVPFAGDGDGTATHHQTLSTDRFSKGKTYHRDW